MGQERRNWLESGPRNRNPENPMVHDDMQALGPAQYPEAERFSGDTCLFTMTVPKTGHFEGGPSGAAP